MKNEVIKCKNVTKRRGVEHECGRFVAKFVNDSQIHIKCSSCPAYTVIRVVDGILSIVHVDKKSEEEICKKA